MNPVIHKGGGGGGGVCEWHSKTKDSSQNKLKHALKEVMFFSLLHLVRFDKLSCISFLLKIQGS